MVAPINQLNRPADPVKAFDDRAIEDFFRIEYQAVWRQCAALVDEASADDLAQETFARAIPALGRFRGDASRRTWLLSIARHVCLDELRVRSRRRRRDGSLILVAATEPTGERGGGVLAPDASADCTVSDLIACLDSDRRVALVLTQLLGFSYAEAAKICECPIGTIRSRVARARSDLLVILSESTPTAGTRAQEPFSSA